MNKIYYLNTSGYFKNTALEILQNLGNLFGKLSKNSLIFSKSSKFRRNQRAFSGLIGISQEFEERLAQTESSVQEF